MKPAGAWIVLAAAVAATAAGLLAPWQVVLVLAVASWLAVARGRLALVLFALVTVLINTLLLAWLTTGTLWLRVGPVELSHQGALLGLIGALRLTAIIAANQVLITRVSMAAWIDGLRLPRRWTAYAAALLLASRDVWRDFERLQDARRLDGAWPASRWARIRAAAGLMPNLLVASYRRATVRREALWLAGHAVGPRFAPIIAVAALAAAGRLAFIAVPNVALTYVVVFAGGAAFGGRVGFWAAFWAMAITDLVLSGFTPSVYVNAPAMGLVGMIGGMFRRMPLDGATTMLAATAGIVCTLVFSIVADVATWAIVPEFRTSVDLLRLRILAGLVFNAIPALTNAVLFAAATPAVLRAFRALGQQEQGEQQDW